MANTSNISIPLVEASQNQKEVTINSGSYLLDALLTKIALDKDLTTPPGSPSEGDIYIVGASATGDWASQDNKIAYYANGWQFIIPKVGWRFYLDDEDIFYTYTGTKWIQSNIIALDDGSYTAERLKKTTLSGLSGATVTTSGFIPDRALVKQLSLRVTTTITGATSFDAGYTSNTQAFGSSIGISLDTTNKGLLGNPQGFFADTDLILTANGSNFTAGEVEVVLHYEEMRGPWDW